jgi:undecaprenyl-diphosphatase
MGTVQGLALPFRGFSRSGSTISTGMLVGATKERAERFSFAMAVVLTPPVVAVEALRLHNASHTASLAGAPIDMKVRWSSVCWKWCSLSSQDWSPSNG